MFQPLPPHCPLEGSDSKDKLKAVTQRACIHAAELIGEALCLPEAASKAHWHMHVSTMCACTHPLQKMFTLLKLELSLSRCSAHTQRATFLPHSPGFICCHPLCAENPSPASLLETILPVPFRFGQPLSMYSTPYIFYGLCLAKWYFLIYVKLPCLSL